MLIDSIKDTLAAHIDQEMRYLIESATAPPGSPQSMIVEIPEATDVDLQPNDLAALVARASNNYQRCCRFSGIARAELKRAEGRYKQAYKKALGVKASNREAREAAATEASSKEHDYMVAIEAIVELANWQENATRNASETARKLFDKVHNMAIADSREEHGRRAFG